MTADYPMRINKYLGRKGVSTRKDADSLIKKGLVYINGRLAVLGDKVNIKDVVEVRGRREKKYSYYAYSKPSGVITHSPQLGEKDIVSIVPLPGVFPVGRLDKRSRGLIILTDDARVTDRLLNPEYVHDKEYRVTVAEKLPRDFKEKMEAGVNIEGYVTKECRVNVSGDHTFTITLTEGKKHQIRRMCAALAVTITDLQRLRVMNVKLGSLKPGQYRELKGAERAEFLRLLGLGTQAAGSSSDR